MENKSKIYVEYFGRLGNQLFQYSTARAIAAANGGEVVNVDWAYIAASGNRPLIHELQVKGRDPSFAERCEIRLLTGRTLGRISKAFPRQFPRLLVDKAEGYRDDLTTQTGSVYLRGYWQSYRYFDTISEDLCGHLRPRMEPSRRSRDASQLFRDDECVAIHVRRGDYVHHAEWSKVFVSHGDSYYRNALRVFAQMYTISKVVVFSDEPQWCRDNLKLDYPTIVMSPPEYGDWEDLWLMAQAKRIAIAASSFSWWAGWLSSKRGGLVVAPKAWRQGATCPPPDLIPPSWSLV